MQAVYTIEVNRHDLHQLAVLSKWLLDITKKSHGVGIAAPQIGESYRVIIVASHANIRYPDAPFMLPMAMINPRIISHSEEIVTATEGCLSVKEKRGNVPRYRNIVVEYITRDGKFEQKKYSDLRIVKPYLRYTAQPK